MSWICLVIAGLLEVLGVVWLNEFARTKESGSLSSWPLHLYSVLAFLNWRCQQFQWAPHMQYGQV